MYICISMEKLDKKALIMRLYDEVQEIMPDLKQELEKFVDYDDPDIQKKLYWLAIILRDLLAFNKKLRERHDEEYRNDIMTMIYNSLLQRIEELWKK